MPLDVANLTTSGHSDGMYTVNHLIDAFQQQLQISIASGNKSPKTQEFYYWRFKKLRAAAGGMPAAELRIWHLNGVKISNHFARVIRKLYGWAVENDLAPRNPFSKLEIPKCGQRERVVSRTEVARLYLGSAKRFRRYLMLMVHTIARPGEIRNLRWSQIDFEAKLITLKKFKSKERRRDGLKARLIPLDRRALMLLIAMRRSTRSEFVFSNKRGDAWTYDSVRSAMRRARAKAGLAGTGDVTEPLVCYTLRHTGATNAMRAGVPLTVLANLMGHTKVTTTQRYQHPTTDDLFEAIHKVGERKKP